MPFHLIGMNIVPSGQLRQGLVALDRRQCHFGFKFRRMIAAGSLRLGSPSFQAIPSLVMDRVATYSVVSKSGDQLCFFESRLLRYHLMYVA